VPVYLLVRTILPNSPWAMLAIAMLIAGVAYALFFLAYRLLIGRPLPLADHLPLLLLASLGSSFYYTLREPNARNIEIGVAFVSMAVAVRYLAGQWSFPTGARSRLLLGGGAAALGLFMFNDLMSTYALILPFAIALIVWFLSSGRRRQAAVVVVFLGVAAVASELWKGLFALLRVATPPAHGPIAGPDQWGYHLTLAVTGLLSMHAADFSGPPVMDLRTLGGLANLGLLALMFAAPAILWALRRPLAWWQWFLLVQPYYFVVIFTLSG